MPKDEFPNENEEQGSVFHPAVDFLIRVNKLMYAANSCALSHDLESWLAILKTIRRELSAEIKEDESKKVNGMLDAIYPIRNEFLYYTTRNIPAPIKVSANLFRMLEDFEMELRRLFNKYHPIPKKDDPRFAIYRR
jgi:hypothetical protein